MSWLNKIFPNQIRTEAKANDNRKGVPEGVWEKCKACGSMLYLPELESNLHVCPSCNYHMRIGARERLNMVFDNFADCEEVASHLRPVDMLKFVDTKKYKDRISAAQKKTGENDALLVFRGQVQSIDMVISAFEFGFLGGSMGSVVGEKFVQGLEYAIEHELPYVCFTASGGARMQESLHSLMQMVKVSAALGKLKALRLPYIVVLTDPTTGGVSASLAMLGDVHLAEPKALIGFAGPRVIEQTVRETLPEGFQRSEFLLEKGMVDQIVNRHDIPERLASIVSKLTYWR